MLSHLDAAIAGVCLTCHDAGRPEGCPRCARREPLVSAVAGEESVTPCAAVASMKTPERLAHDFFAARGIDLDGDDLSASDLACGVRADRSHIAGLLDGIRSAHSAGGELDPVGYVAEVLGLVARMGREG